ncbi:MAG: BrnA antitoxin family protein [Acidobacteria bacterium]|nr:BrnA antitoxin family protein [Acidobacteriota bacterium]
MRKHYNFSKAKLNPYARLLKQQVTIRLDRDTTGYFRKLSEQTGIRYQTLINLYLRECASSGKRLSIAWRPAVNKGAA